MNKIIYKPEKLNRIKEAIKKSKIMTAEDEVLSYEKLYKEVLKWGY
ncbi:MAG: hypothetical protein LRY73_18240 [Bacillus sp. (in: Bacteria)]|nr:hypothetical protein [Bacillus sp. (in: firmicutes)]